MKKPVKDQCDAGVIQELVVNEYHASFLMLRNVLTSNMNLLAEAQLYLTMYSDQDKGRAL